MRQIIIAVAMALGLIALWAAILPLAAEPAPAQTALAAPAMSKALFLCRGPNGIDRTCAAALAQVLVLDASDRLGHIDREMPAGLAHHGGSPDTVALRLT